MDAIIQVEGLTKLYKDRVVVDHISFTVERGEVFGILGPNGAGKTTTLEMMEGLQPVSEGAIVIDGISVPNQPHLVRQKIGAQLQTSVFYDGLNLKQLLEFFGSLYGRAVDAMQLLAQVALADKWDQQARHLSGGQRQRLSIAVAIVNNPVVLFLDEPTTGLDPQARHHLWDLIRSIQAGGATIILTTHYMEEAEVLCDTIAIMDNAKIVTMDSLDGLLQNVDQQATISFRSQKNIDLSVLNQLVGVIGAHQIKQTITLRTQNVQGSLEALIDYDRVQQLEYTDLQVHKTNLEDVFLALTGKRLRD
jgi:ABC-2 type transport system ATP-binding protein